MSYPTSPPTNARALPASRPAQSLGWIVPIVSQPERRAASRRSTPALLGRFDGRRLRSLRRGAPLARLLRGLLHRRVSEIQGQNQAALVPLHVIAQCPQRPTEDRRGADAVAFGETAELLHLALIETNRDSLFLGGHIKV